MSPYEWSHGELAIEIAARCRMTLDKWQSDTLVDACGCRHDGKFASFEVGLNVPRQNGKGSVLEARELLAIELGDRLVIHSSHEWPTSLTAMNRMEELLEDGGLIGTLHPRSGISRSHGSEGFKFKSGQRIWYRSRTKGGGRGFSADLVVLDEAMILQETFIAALMPTMSARSMQANPQLWYTGSAVDQLSMEHGVVFSRLRKRGLDGGDPSLAYFEWSAYPAFDEEGRPVTPDSLTSEMLHDRKAWARGNPGLGIRISEEHIEKELRSMDPRTFSVERDGVGDYPALDGTQSGAISLDDWNHLEDSNSAPAGDIVFVFDVRPDRAKATIVAAGMRGDGKVHVEIIKYKPGTNWVVPELVRLRDQHQPMMILRTAHGPVSALRTQIDDARLDVTEVSATDFAEACGRFVDMVNENLVRHRGEKEFQAAVKGAKTRPVGEAFAWSRKLSTGDVSPLITATVGAWIAEQRLTSVYAERGILTI